MTHTDLKVPAGGELIVAIHAQNGMDTERTLEIHLQPRKDVGRGGHLGHDKLAVMVLPPGAAGTLTIPVTVHPKARRNYQITIVPEVKGNGGQRIRVYRAKQFAKKVSSSTQLLALLLGMFVWGGGMTIDLTVAKNKKWKEMPVDDPAPSTAQLFYEPDRAMLVGFQSRMS